MWAQLWSWVLSTYKANIGFSAQWPSHPFPLLFSPRTAASPADTHFIWIWKIPIKFPAAVSDPSVSCASSRGPGLKWCEGSPRHYHEGWTGQPAGCVNNILGSDPTNFLTEPENSLHFIIGPLSQLSQPGGKRLPAILILATSKCPFWLLSSD